eukprot:Rmarinus@m.29245
MSFYGTRLHELVVSTQKMQRKIPEVRENDKIECVQIFFRLVAIGDFNRASNLGKTQKRILASVHPALPGMLQDFAKLESLYSDWAFFSRSHATLPNLYLQLSSKLEESLVSFSGSSGDAIAQCCQQLIPLISLRVSLMSYYRTLKLTSSASDFPRLASRLADFRDKYLIMFEEKGLLGPTLPGLKAGLSFMGLPFNALVKKSRVPSESPVDFTSEKSECEITPSGVRGVCGDSGVDEPAEIVVGSGAGPTEGTEAPHRERNEEQGRNVDGLLRETQPSARGSLPKGSLAKLLPRGQDRVIVDTGIWELTSWELCTLSVLMLLESCLEACDFFQCSCLLHTAQMFLTEWKTRCFRMKQTASTSSSSAINKRVLDEMEGNASMQWIGRFFESLLSKMTFYFHDVLFALDSGVHLALTPEEPISPGPLHTTMLSDHMCGTTPNHGEGLAPSMSACTGSRSGPKPSDPSLALHMPEAAVSSRTVRSRTGSGMVAGGASNSDKVGLFPANAAMTFEDASGSASSGALGSQAASLRRGSVRGGGTSGDRGAGDINVGLEVRDGGPAETTSREVQAVVNSSARVDESGGAGSSSSAALDPVAALVWGAPTFGLNVSDAKSASGGPVASIPLSPRLSFKSSTPPTQTPRPGTTQVPVNYATLFDKFLTRADERFLYFALVFDASQPGTVWDSTGFGYTCREFLSENIQRENGEGSSRTGTPSEPPCAEPMFPSTPPSPAFSSMPPTASAGLKAWPLLLGLPVNRKANAERDLPNLVCLIQEGRREAARKMAGDVHRRRLSFVEVSPTVVVSGSTSKDDSVEESKALCVRLGSGADVYHVDPKLGRTYFLKQVDRHVTAVVVYGSDKGSSKSANAKPPLPYTPVPSAEKRTKQFLEKLASALNHIPALEEIKSR